MAIGKHLLLFSLWVVSTSLWPCRLYHTRLLCPPLSLAVCSNSCPLNWWCYLLLPLLLLPSIFPRIRVFSNELALCTRWPKYWSFISSISPFNESLGWISFRIDWFDLFCSPRDSQESPSAPQFESISSSLFSLLYDPALTSVHDYWKNHSFDKMDLCQQGGASAL